MGVAKEQYKFFKDQINVVKREDEKMLPKQKMVK